MAEFLVFGVGASVHIADAITNWSVSPDAGNPMDWITAPFHPVGPSGKTVMRRIYVNTRHPLGIGFYTTPIVDGRELTYLKKFFSRPAPGANETERWTFPLPMGKAETNYARAIRGATLQLHFEATNPTTEWYVESATLAHRPIGPGMAGARGREVTD